MTRVHVRVQHAPGREQPLARLLASLQTPAVVVADRGGGHPSPWRGYQQCLADLPADATHVVVLQDDTIACRNFPPAVERIAAEWPDHVVCLFLGGAPRRTASLARRAQANGRSYCRLHPNDFVPVVATMWPVQKAESLLSWTCDNPARLGHVDPRSDDAVAGRWMRYNREQVVCTVPSLVQHPDDVPSTIGRKHRAGEDVNRVAALWIGADDPLALDWSRQRMYASVR